MCNSYKWSYPYLLRKRPDYNKHSHTPEIFCTVTTKEKARGSGSRLTLQTILNIRKNSVSIKSPLQWGLVHLCAVFHSSGSISQSTFSLELGPPGPGRGSAATHWVESPTQLPRGPRVGTRVTCCQDGQSSGRKPPGHWHPQQISGLV